MYSETLEYLGNHELKPFVVGTDIELMSSKDERVPIQADLNSETFEIDADGNKVIVYSGGLMIKNYYEDRKHPLLFEVFVPVEKAVIEMKQSKGIAKWEYEAAKSRVKLMVEPIPAREQAIINFVMYNRDAILIQNPTKRLNVRLTEEMKRRLLDQLGP